MFQVPVLTRNRVRLAYTVAITADALQFLLLPLSWTFVEQVIDVVAMIFTWRLIGFHPLLLPTFVVEFLPGADLVRTGVVITGDKLRIPSVGEPFQAAAPLLEVPIDDGDFFLESRP